MIYILLSILLYALMGAGLVLLKYARNQHKLRVIPLVLGIASIVSSNVCLKVTLYYMDLSEQYPLSITLNITVIILGIIFLQERLTFKKGLVIVLTLFGIYYIIFPDFYVLNWSLLVGLTVVLAVSTCIKYWNRILPKLDTFFGVDSLGHFTFGFNTGIIYIILYLFYTESSLSYQPLAIYFTPLSLFIFLGWELLEHTLVKNYIYPRFGVTAFYESRLNMVHDVILGEAGFFTAYGILFYSYDLTIALITLGIAQLPAFGCAYLLNRSRRKSTLITFN